MARPNSTPAPSHLALAALVLVIWHLALAADYVIARFALAPVLGADELPALMPLLPLGALWMQACWVAGVVLGLVAALFLALRDDASVLLFFAAFVAMAACTAGFAFAPAASLAGPALWATGAVLALVPLLGWLYARALNRGGVLH